MQPKLMAAVAALFLAGSHATSVLDFYPNKDCTGNRIASFSGDGNRGPNDGFAFSLNQYVGSVYLSK